MPIVNSFKWEGEGFATQRRKRNELHYQSFKNGNLSVNVDDFVLIRNDYCTDPEDLKYCYVAKIKDLYDTGESEEPFKAKVQWYSRIFELPSHFIDGLNNVDYNHELIEEHRTDFGNTVDAESIFNKCVVIFLPVNIESDFSLSTKNGKFPAFYCRYKYSGIKLIPLALERVTRNSGKNVSVVPLASQTPNQKKLKSMLIPKRSRSVGKRSVKTPSVQSSKQTYTVRLNEDKIQLKPLSVTISRISDLVLNNLNKNCKILVYSDKSDNEKSSPRTPKSSLQLGMSGHRRSSSRFKVGKREVLLSKKSPKAAEMEKESPYKSPVIHTLTYDTPGPNLKSVASENKYFETNLEYKSHNSSFTADQCKTVSPMKRPFLQNNECFSTPSKRERTRRMLDFTGEKQVSSECKDSTVTTRYGRKVKPVSNLLESNLDLLLSTPEKVHRPNKQGTRKNANFYHSDVSDSEESIYSPTGSSCSSDESEAVKPLPSELPSSKKRATPVRRSIARTSYSLKKSLVHVTPTLPKRQQPVKTPMNSIEESRQRLHVSAVPNSLPCRDEEYSDIYAFIESNLINCTGGCMYISGVPGTGKTATVHEVIRNLEEERSNNHLPAFQYVEVNGMKMTDPYQCYVQIFKALTGDRIAPQQAANMLEKRFTKPGPKKEAVVLVVDELDKLWTRKQTVMYSIFDWPTKPSSKLIVIAIANTMDLPERMMMNRISSRLGLTRKTFQPYTFKELQTIIMSRIQELNVFDPDAVQLVARKVAAVSGDARRALEICRRAAEIAEDGSVEISPKKKSNVLVGMGHVDAALNQVLSSPEVTAIRGCSELQKLFFKSLLSEFQRTGSEETTFFKAYRQLVGLCRFEGLHPPTTSEVSGLCAHLASSYLILIDNIQNDLFMKIRLNVSIDDVNYALTGRIS